MNVRSQVLPRKVTYILTSQASHHQQQNTYPRAYESGNVVPGERPDLLDRRCVRLRLLIVFTKEVPLHLSIEDKGPGKIFVCGSTLMGSSRVPTYLRGFLSHYVRNIVGSGRRGERASAYFTALSVAQRATWPIPSNWCSSRTGVLNR